MNQRLQQQMAFIRELDQLKHINRRSLLLDKSRMENSAEHSWHVAMAVWLLAEHSDEEIDSAKVMKMMMIHDIVEIDAGDTYVYDPEAMKEKAKLEIQAADRLFNMLPADQALQLRTIWDEFEAGETAEARFAGAVDRLLPVTHNHGTDGKSWKDHHVSVEQILNQNQTIAKGSQSLWQLAKNMILEAASKAGLRQTP